MTDDRPSWDLYRSLLAVLEHGSLSGAARSLGLSQPTLSRQIAALESELGVALFTRSPGGLKPTEAALQLRPHAEAMAAAAAALVRSAGPDDGASGVVRISVSEVMGGTVLPPIIAELRADHPRLVIELILSNTQDDLLRRDADIAVRMARPTQGALYGRRLRDIEVGLFASPSYVQRNGLPESLAQRDRHTVVGFDKIPFYAARTISDVPITRELFDVRSNSDLAQYALIMAGAGIGAVQAPLARRMGLTPILADAFSFPMEMWVVMHEDLKTTPRMRLVFDALVEGLNAYVRE